jgi:hypothetical protein
MKFKADTDLQLLLALELTSGLTLQLVVAVVVLKSVRRLPQNVMERQAVLVVAEPTAHLVLSWALVDQRC